ncbi:MAG TPA: hypothetical protein VF628_09295 [Allosphingosinicella sp.]|jgi:uncharacterized membrane protein YphA (DoxX/SURF4 family)
MSTADIFEWYATITGIIAAIMLASDLGRKVTGYGFVLFCTMNIAWILFARTQEEGAGLMWQNGVLFAVNLFGVYQYLLSAKNRRKMEVVEKAVEKFEAKEEARAEGAV